MHDHMTLLNCHLIQIYLLWVLYFKAKNELSIIHKNIVIFRALLLWRKLPLEHVNFMMHFLETKNRFWYIFLGDSPGHGDFSFFYNTKYIRIRIFCNDYHILRAKSR